MSRHFFSDITEEFEKSEGPREEWIYITELCSNNLTNEENNVEVNEEYWSQYHQKSSEEEIANVANWLSDKKIEKSENQFYSINNQSYLIVFKERHTILLKAILKKHENSF